MAVQADIDVIRRIKKSYENVMIVIGVTIGMILLAYFFTFAQFVDRGYTGAVWFQIVSTVLLAIALVFLRQLSFAVVRMIHGRRSACRPFLDAVRPADLGKDERTLLELYGR